MRIYNLAEQKLLKTLQTGIRWVSCMDVHPLGDHLIVGGYDRKLCWFDLELSDRPYKVLRYHERAIRAVHFHPTHPLQIGSNVATADLSSTRISFFAWFARGTRMEQGCPSLRFNV